MRHSLHSLALLFVVVCLAGGASWAAAEELELVVERTGGVSEVYVEVAPSGETGQRHLLRVTDAEAQPSDKGWSAARDAAFVTWTENGNAWTAYSRDNGASWSRAQGIKTELRLLDKNTAPGEVMPAPEAGLELPAGGELFIVQFKTIALPEWRSDVAALGGTVLQFFPNNAYIVRLPASLMSQVAALEFVERVEPYHPSYRLEPELRDWIAEPADAEPQEMRVRVQAFEWGPTGKGRILQAAEAAGGRIADYWESGHILELWVTRDALRTVAAHADVIWADRWTPDEDDMDILKQDSGAVSLESSTGRCGQGVRGEVMDNGIQSNHPDFDGILLHNSPDTQSHGTNTYGMVFSNGTRDGDGNAQGEGHLPCAEQGIFLDYGPVSDRFAATQDLKSSPYFASFQTNSWGSSRTTTYTTNSQEMDDIIWQLDILILQSQSNAGNQQSRPQAWAKNIVAVGGIRHFNTLTEADDAWNFGASIGPAADGRIKPDLNYWYDSIFTTTTGSGYTSSFGGTSAATPASAGVIGLMIQMWAENVWGTNPVGTTVFEKQPHFGTIKALAINNAKQYTFSGTTDDLTRMHQGWGRPNAQIALDRAAASFVVDQDTPLALGQVASYDIDVQAGETELKVTMVYPDPPGTTSASLHRINNVDLRVTSPSSTVYHGNNGLDAANYSTAGGSPNDIDTVENVFVQNPESGTWTVEVTAAEVNQDAHVATPATDVVFALVVTGGTEIVSVCGDGVVEGPEECDCTDLATGTGCDFDGADCSTGGCDPGALSPAICNLDCTIDFIGGGCANCPVCGNGSCELGETCFNCSDATGGDCRSGAGFTCGNAVCETADGENCLSCPQDCNGITGGKKSDRYCCGDGTAGENPVTCSDSRCVLSGNTCLSTNAPDSCCGDGTCDGDEDGNNCPIDCGTPGGSCGDGTCNNTEDQCSCAADCGTPPSSETPFLDCTDGLDNDCDGQTDCNDNDCSGDAACSCGVAGTSCNSPSECCSGKCNGPSGRKTCR